MGGDGRGDPNQQKNLDMPVHVQNFFLPHELFVDPKFKTHNFYLSFFHL